MVQSLIISVPGQRKWSFAIRGEIKSCNMDDGLLHVKLAVTKDNKVQHTFHIFLIRSSM